MNPHDDSGRFTFGYPLMPGSSEPGKKGVNGDSTKSDAAGLAPVGHVANMDEGSVQV